MARPIESRAESEIENLFSKWVAPESISKSVEFVSKDSRKPSQFAASPRNPYCYTKHILISINLKNTKNKTV